MNESQLCAWCDSPFEPGRSTQKYCPGGKCSQDASNARRYGRTKPHAAEPQEDTLAQEIANRAKEFLETKVPLPAVPKLLHATRVEELDLHEQEAVGLFSDYHYCEVIDPRATGGIGLYNEELARERLARWRDGTLRFTQMMQCLMPVKHYHLFALGDEFAGHGKMFRSQAFKLSATILFQVVGFVDDMSNVLVDLSQRYERITVYKVYGNHGRIGQAWNDLPQWDNLELLAWSMIRDRVRAAGLGEDRIEFHITVSPFVLAEIMGKTFLGTHGETTKPWSPYAASGVYNAKLRTNALLGEVINYWVLGHHHVPYHMERELEGQIRGNGSFSGPGDLAVNKMREANLPSQELFFVHPKYGITHPHRIHLATVEDIRNVHVIGRTRGKNPAEI